MIRNMQEKQYKNRILSNERYLSGWSADSYFWNQTMCFKFKNNRKSDSQIFVWNDITEGNNTNAGGIDRGQEWGLKRASLFLLFFFVTFRYWRFNPSMIFVVYILRLISLENWKKWLQITKFPIKSSTPPSQSVFEKSFPQSARPTLRYILPEFGCRSSPLRRFHPNKISHKLWRTSCEKHFSNTF